MDARADRPMGVSQVVAAFVLVVFAVFALMLTMGAASFVNECRGVQCGQLHQAVFAGLAAGASLFAASRLVSGRPSVAAITFFGTLPLLVVHVVLVVSDPDESIFFPLSTAPVPTVAGALLLYGVAIRGLLHGVRRRRCESAVRRGVR